MGYSITIGNAYLEGDPEDLYAYYDVEPVRHEDAVHIENDDTDKTNCRLPSYCVFSDWSEEVGLYEMFYDEDEGLLRPHPGTKRLTEGHLEQVRAAIERYKEANPGKRPGFWREDPNDWTEVIEDPELSPTLARLIWFEYWIAWALKDCEIPAMRNS